MKLGQALAYCEALHGDDADKPTVTVENNPNFKPINRERESQAVREYEIHMLQLGLNPYTGRKFKAA
jgi:hypothetical protein